MAEATPEPSALSLPDAPNLDWLRKQAKRRLEEMRQSNPDTKLADAPFDLAKRYGFPVGGRLRRTSICRRWKVNSSMLQKMATYAGWPRRSTSARTGYRRVRGGTS